MANRKPISHSTSDNPVPGGYIGPVWIDPAQDTIDGKIYVSQSGVVLGRTSTGAGAHEEILISSLGGGGITSKTYAEMADLIAADGLTAGALYLITDAAGTTGGFLTYATTVNTLSPSGVGVFQTQAAETEYDPCEYVFADNQLTFRSDKRSNVVRGADAVAAFPFGYDNLTGFQVNNAIVDLAINLNAIYRNCTLFPGAEISGIIVGDGTTIENNILENGAHLTGITAGANCSISRNKIGQGATLGIDVVIDDNTLIDGNTIEADGLIGTITTGTGCEINKNKVGAGGNISVINMVANCQLSINEVWPDGAINTISMVGPGAVMAYNNAFSFDTIEIGENSFVLYLQIQGRVTEITAGVGCTISELNVARGYTLTGYTLADGESITGLNYGQFPAMSEATRDALIAPAAGMEIFNTDTNKKNLYTGSAWEEITSA